MGKDFLNYDDVYETFLNLYKDVIKDYGYDYGSLEDVTEDYAEMNAFQTLDDMKRYCHKKNTRIEGNFCNIREDWEVTKEFVESDVKPWGKFDDVVKSIDNGTISDEDLRKFQTWAFDWFFTAFGTIGLEYNFGNFISDVMYEREEEE